MNDINGSYNEEENVEAPKKEIIRQRHEEFLQTTEGHLDFGGEFLPGALVASRLDITEKTLSILAESGEFQLGRVAGRLVVDKKSLMAYLDRNHFVGRENDSQPIVYDSKGRIKKELTLVGDTHADVPELKNIREFAVRLYLDDRSFLRHCETGTFPHYRIGTNYKMSENDWIDGLKRVTEKGMKSNRGNRKSNAGRKLKITGIAQELLTDSGDLTDNK